MGTTNGANRSPHHFAADYQLGVAAYDCGRYSEAISLLSRMADRGDAAGTLSRFYLGQAHLQIGLGELRSRRFKPAIQHLQAAAAADRTRGDLGRHLAAAYAGDGRYDLASREFEGMIARGAGDSDTPIRMAHSQWRQGRPEAAIETMLGAIRRERGRAELHFQLGLFQAAADDYAAAISAFSEATRLAPGDADAHQHLGLTYAATGELGNALTHLRVARRLAPRDSYLALQFALATQAAAGEGIALEPEDDLPAGGKFDQRAIERLGQTVLGDPDFVEAFLALPQTGIDRDVFATLAATLEWALERHSEYADLHFHCSRVYERLGRRDEAIAAAARALQANPQYVQAMIHLGRLYAETDQTQDGIDRLQEAIERGGDYPDVHYLLGQLYRRRGDRPRARRSFERALELNEGYSAARSALAELSAA